MGWFGELGRWAGFAADPIGFWGIPRPHVPGGGKVPGWGDNPITGESLPTVDKNYGGPIKRLFGEGDVATTGDMKKLAADIEKYKQYYTAILGKYDLGPKEAPQLGRASWMVPEGTRSADLPGTVDSYGPFPGFKPLPGAGGSGGLPSGGPQQWSSGRFAQTVIGKPTSPMANNGFTGDSTPFGRGDSGSGLFPPLPSAPISNPPPGPPMVGKPTMAQNGPGALTPEEIVRRARLQQLIDELNGGGNGGGMGMG